MSDLCKLLDKITEGTATAADEAALDEHAQQCAACARELAWQRREHALFAARKARQVAPLWKDVEARIATPAPRRQASWIAGAVAAAAAILLLVKSVPMALHHEAPQPVVVMPAQGAALPESAAPVRPSSHASVQSWKLTLEGITRIAISDGDGSVTLRPTNENALHVVASTDDDLEGWKIHVERVGKEASARVDCAHTCGDKPSVDFVVEVPRSAPKVVVDTIDADVDVADVGSVTVHTVSGDVHTKGAGLERVKTTSGDIHVEDAPSAALALDSISGEVSWAGHCHKGCAVHVQTISGDVDFHPDQGSAYDRAIAFADARPSIRKKGGPGSLEVGTVSGDVDFDDASDASDEPFAAAGFIESAPSGVVAVVGLPDDQLSRVELKETVKVSSSSKPGVVVTGIVTMIGEEDERRGVTPVTISIPKDSFLPQRSVLCRFGEVAAPDATIAIGSSLGGLVKEVDVRVGDEVHKGQVVARLDSSAAEAELSAVEVEVEQAEKAYEQQEMLFKAGATTMVQIAQTKSLVALSKAKMRAPAQRIAMASVRALVPGYVKEVLVHPGETVAANGPVVTTSKTKK